MAAEVLIVGCGPVGMTMALLLSRWGMTSHIVDRAAGLPGTPQAHVIRSRSMDVFAKLGIDTDIERALPDNPQKYVTWCAQLAGTEIGRLELDPTGLSPAWTNLPQNLLSPILLDQVRNDPRVTVEFDAECTTVTQAEEGVTAELERKGNGKKTRVAADWVIGADGAASSVRNSLGISMAGEEMLGRFHMIHFSADLREWIAPRPGPLAWVLNPDAPGVLIFHDPACSHVFMTPFEEDADENCLRQKLTGALGIGIELDILAVRSWTAKSQVADSYRSDRVFLCGDAAHRFPPTGGLGLNTGIVDAHNLAWKLALVHQGKAAMSLLDTYEEECRSVALVNAAASHRNQQKLIEVFQAIGPFGSLAELEGRLAGMSEPEKRQVQQAIDNQVGHFLSDGLFPRSVQGFDFVDMLLVPDYQHFRLLTDHGDDWTRVLDNCQLPVNLQPPGNPPFNMKPNEAVLVRPDDQLAWIGSDPAALDAVLMEIVG